jgi:hypothetical protein
MNMHRPNPQTVNYATTRDICRNTYHHVANGMHGLCYNLVNDEAMISPLNINHSGPHAMRTCPSLIELRSTGGGKSRSGFPQDLLSHYGGGGLAVNHVQCRRNVPRDLGSHHADAPSW